MQLKEIVLLRGFKVQLLKFQLNFNDHLRRNIFINNMLFLYNEVYLAILNSEFNEIENSFFLSFNKPN